MQSESSPHLLLYPLIFTYISPNKSPTRLILSGCLLLGGLSQTCVLYAQHPEQGLRCKVLNKYLLNELMHEQGDDVWAKTGRMRRNQPCKKPGEEFFRQRRYQVRRPLGKKEFVLLKSKSHWGWNTGEGECGVRWGKQSRGGQRPQDLNRSW